MPGAGRKYPSVVPAKIIGTSMMRVVQRSLRSVVPGRPSHLLRIIRLIRFRDTTLDMASSPPLAVDMDAPTTPIKMAAPMANGMYSTLSSGMARSGSVSAGR